MATHGCQRITSKPALNQVLLNFYVVCENGTYEIKHPIYGYVDIEETYRFNAHAGPGIPVPGFSQYAFSADTERAMSRFENFARSIRGQRGTFTFVFRVPWLEQMD